MRKLLGGTLALVAACLLSAGAASAQKGPISAHSERGPVRPHTHRRFSSNEGMVPTLVAITFAHSAVVIDVATRTARMVRLTDVEATDTAA